MTKTDKVIAVLLPGIDGTGKMFGPLIEQLPDCVEPQVISYPTQEELSYQQLTDYVFARLPQGRAYIIIAESFAGPLALMLTERTTENLKAVILCATFLSNPRPWLARLAPVLLNEWLVSQPPRKWMARLVITGSSASDEMLERVLMIHKEVSPRVLLRRLREVINVNVRQQFKQCRIPVLHFFARHDHTVLNYSTREIQSMRPDIKSIEIDGPHFLLQTRPKQCMQHIEPFLAGVLHS